MAYQIRYIKQTGFSRGFSLIELLVVIAISTLFFSISTSVYNSFKSHSNLEIATNGLVEAVRLAQSSAQSGKGDALWGVKVLSTEVVIFKGNSYAGRDISFDEALAFSGGITASGLTEIVFQKLTGSTGSTGTIILTNGQESKNININAKGTVTY